MATENGAGDENGRHAADFGTDMFQVEPFSRLIPSSFSVNAARVVADTVVGVMVGLLAYGRFVA